MQTMTDDIPLAIPLAVKRGRNPEGVTVIACTAEYTATCGLQMPPGTPGFCPCGGIILADTEHLTPPLCAECWHEIGEP